MKTGYSITRGQCFDKLCEPKIRIDKMIINDQKFSYIFSCKMEENVIGIEKGKILENWNFFARKEFALTGIVCPKAEGCGLLAVYPSPSAELLAAELM